MQWHEVFHGDQEPTEQQIKDFIATPLWQDLSDHLTQTYRIKQKKTYSRCSMGDGYWMGWNIKFQKSGKSLCTVYPKQGFFVAMISFSAKELDDADVLIQMCEDYTKEKYQEAKASKLGKSISCFPRTINEKNTIINCLRIFLGFLFAIALTFKIRENEKKKFEEETNGRVPERTIHSRSDDA